MTHRTRIASAYSLMGVGTPLRSPAAAELEIPLHDNDARMCVTADQHRPYWRYDDANNRYVCRMCLLTQQALRGGNLVC